MKINKIIIMVFTLVLIPLSNSFAHKVIIFAWVEDKMIFSESQFASKKKVKDSPILVFDEKGNIIHQGRTNNEGEYSFKIPEHVDSDLVLKIDAGQGHQGQWKILKSELLEQVTNEDPKASIKENKRLTENKRLKEKHKLKEKPSIIKIMSGIGIIFLLALGLKYIKRKKV